MYRGANDIIGYTLMAQDGEIGRCIDFLFEDRPWIVRYMVADTGRFLPRRKVLIPLVELNNPDESDQLLHVDLTRKQIEGSPSLSEDEPVSSQFERISYLYYGWPAYWADADQDADQENTVSTNSGASPKEENNGAKESRLRSIREVTGYHIDATNGNAGQVSDFIVDDNIWAIRYLVVDLKNGPTDQKILLAPDWVNKLDWLNRVVKVDLSVDGISNCPGFNASEPLAADLESMVSWSNWTKEYIRNLEQENLLLKLSIKKYKKQLQYLNVKINTK